MLTRSQLLKSKLPRPDMSTSPSGLIQSGDAKNSHPYSVQEFDVIPEVLNYISSLGVTPKRFKPLDYGRQHVRFCFAIGLVSTCCCRLVADPFIVLSIPLSTSHIVLKAHHVDHHVLHIG